ncbi:hypothetical protein TWF696_000267 [Orbilia brochopaga]|uniref:Nucleoside phosphorylase domain-containing protein n=1 Tax=Orbilia brochopaga TaxID=3140254 RepID=A0AAV9VAR5_9PEZI
MARQLNSEDYTIGWVCTLPEERTAACAILDEEHLPLPRQDGLDINVYEFGRVGLCNIIIATPPAGLYGYGVGRRALAQMRRSFPSITACLVVGVGGGVPALPQRDIRLGDVVVSESVVDLGVRASKLYEATQEGRLVKTRPPEQFLVAIAELKSESEPWQDIGISVNDITESGGSLPRFNRPPNDSDQLFQADYDHSSENESCDQCETGKLIERPPRTYDQPHIHYGRIAVSDRVIKRGTTRDRLAQEYGILCFDMAAAGLIDSLPSLVIRGICDYSDSHKSKLWRPYAALSAAAFAKTLLLRLSSKAASNKSNRTKNILNPPTAEEVVLGSYADRHELSFRDFSSDNQGKYYKAMQQHRQEPAGHEIIESTSYNDSGMRDETASIENTAAPDVGGIINEGESSKRVVKVCRSIFDLPFQRNRLFYLRLFQSTLWNSLSKCRPNHRRKYWICSCGTELFHDFDEQLRHPEHQAFLPYLVEAKFECSRASQIFQSLRELFRPKVPTLPIANAHSSASGVQSATNVPLSSNSSSSGTATLPQSIAQQSPAPGQGFKYCLFHTSNSTQLHHIKLDDNDSDHFLFSNISLKYRMLQPTWKRSLSLRCLDYVELCRFRLVYMGPVGRVHGQNLESAPTIEVSSAEYELSHPELLPVQLLHFVQSPHCLFDLTSTTNTQVVLKAYRKMVPLKKDSLPIIDATNPIEDGWGIHLRVGLDFGKLWLCTALSLLLSLVFALVWSIVKQDAQTGFTISSFNAALISVIVAVGTFQSAIDKNWI